MRRQILQGLFTALAVSGVTLGALAASNTLAGAVAGSVTRGEGEPVPSAVVRGVWRGPGDRADVVDTTGTDGAYRLTELTPGLWGVGVDGTRAPTRVVEVKDGETAGGVDFVIGS